MPRRVVAAIALMVALFPQHIPARAQEQPAAMMRVARVSPFVDGNDPLRLVVQVTNQTELALEDVALRVTFFSAVSSRSELRDVVDRQASRASIGTVTEELPETIAPGHQARLELERSLDALPFLRRNGVYPVEIAVQHALGTTSTRTAVPAFTEAPREPINIVWLLPLTAPVVTPPNDMYPVDVVDRLGMDLLTQQMQALANRPRSGITLAPSPALLDTLATLASGFAVEGPTGPVVRAESSDEARRARELLELMRRAVDAGEVVASPYAPVDVAALASQGLADDLVRHVTLGRATIEARLGRSAAPRLLAAPTVDAGAARALASVGADAFVLPPASLFAPPDEPFEPQLFGPSRPVAIDTGSGEGRALLVDTEMSARIDASPEGVLLAQTLIAETASAWFELPLYAPDRVLVLASETAPTPVALRAALDGFRAAPWVQLRTASAALRSFEPMTDATQLVAARTRDADRFQAARNARAQLRVLSSITVDALEEHPKLDRLVLLSEAAAPDDGAALALARAVSSRVRAIIRSIGVAKSSPVTMTSKRDEVPVTITNMNKFPVRVRVRLQSPKLRFPDGATLTREIAPPRQRLDVIVEARAAGSFPLEVLVQTPDGSRVLARGDLTVRSTAISAVALAVVGGSLGLLLFSWARRSTRRRKLAAAR